MKIRMNKINLKDEDLYVFISFFAIIMCAYALFLNQTYVCDNVPVWAAYKNETASYNGISWEQLKNTILGERPVFIWSIINYWLYCLGIDYLNHQWLFQFINTCLLSLDATLAFRLYCPYISSEMKPILFGCTLIGAINPAFVQIFIFADCSHTLALFFGICALYMFRDRHYVLCTLFLYLMIGTYQSYYAVFMILSLVLILMSGQGSINKNGIKQCGYAIISVAIPCVLLITVPRIAMRRKIINEGSITKEITSSTTDFLIKDAFNRVIVSFNDLINSGYGYTKTGFVKYYLLLIFIITIIVLLIRKRFKDIFVFVFLSAAFFFIPFAFGIIYTASSPYVMRAMVSFYIAIASYTLIAYMYSFEWSDMDNKGRKISIQVAIIMIALYLIVDIKGVETGISDILTANKLEFQICRQLKSEIDNYTAETGIEISTIKVASYKPARIAFDSTYMNIPYNGNYSLHLLLDTSWSDVATINLIYGTDYVREEATEEEMEKYFGDIAEKYDYNYYFEPDDQIVFEGNTLYWLLY